MTSPALMVNNLPWTESPFFESLLEQSDLHAEDKAFVKGYANEGYAIFDPKISSSTIDALVETMSPQFAKLTNGDNRIQDAWTFNKYVQEVAGSEVVLDKLRLLYRREPWPFQTLNFPVGSQQKTHSDMIHFNSIPERFMCGVWVALEDITHDNGPLHYYPGSHKLPFYDMLDLGVKASETMEMKKSFMAYAGNYEIFIEEMVKALKLQKQVLNIKKGQALIWSANLLHGGETILRPGASRHSQVTHYYFDNCVYYAPRMSDIAINKIYIRDMVNIKTGEKVQSKYFDQRVKPQTKLFLQLQTVKTLAKISHLFPRPLVNKIKSIIYDL